MSTSANKAYLQLSNIGLSLGGKRILDAVSLDANRGDLIGLLGPSGGGKTTILNVIGGFLRPDEGSVRIGGDDVVSLPPHKRDIGITFQSYALFPHLTIFENIAYGLRQRKLPKDEIVRRVTEMLATVSLSGYEERYSKSLSGGEQQRVALARALVVQPRLMLLDEPLANLDASLRHRVRFEIREVLRRTNVTSIFVTHDQDEAFALCDKVAVLKSGRIQQFGTPEELITDPVNDFVARFIGCPNIFKAKVREYHAGQRQVTFDIGGFAGVARCVQPVTAGETVEVFVRPELVSIQSAEAESSFQVRDWVYLGSGREFWLEGPLSLRGRLAHGARPVDRGDMVRPSWEPNQAFAFPAA